MARNVVRFNPFAELDAWEKRLFEGGFPWRGAKLPTTDVYTRDDNTLVVETHLPGFGQDDISVSMDAGALVIEAEKHEKTEETKKNYVMRESTSSYYRRIELPEGSDVDSIAAEFEAGVLKVTVPIREITAPKKIQITPAPATPPTPIEPATS
ncbi:MAG: Hsp20/alpha crystallin family protein [Actinomycetales bacterium]|jgi:Molecular chaperone (small heat shock protein)|nr:Hsp20/alpha crystallin family protein [Actinomycetales bacterium]